MDVFRTRRRKPTPGPVTNEKVCQAVRERRIVRCVYGSGEARIIQPYCHGHSHQGHEVLSAYQLQPTAESKEGWKMFDVAELIDFELQDETFAVREDFNPEHPGMTQIHCLKT